MNDSRLRIKTLWAVGTATVLCLANLGGCGSTTEVAKPSENTAKIAKGLTGQGEDSLETKRGGVTYKSIKNRPQQ